MAREVEINWGPNREIVASLVRTGTRFIILGSTGLRYYVPEARKPNDLDLFIEPSLAALDTFRAAAAAWGFSFTETLTDTHLAKPNLGFPAKTQGGFGLNIDVFVKSEGLDFEVLWRTAEPATMCASDTTVRVASIATLENWLTRAITKEPSRAERIRQDLDVLRRAARGG